MLYIDLDIDYMVQLEGGAFEGVVFRPRGPLNGVNV